jgi:hypothetical protein
MSNPKPSARPASGAPGVKLLITAASLVSTIGGWALISNNTAAPATSTDAPLQPVAARAIEFGPLPTLVPPPDPNALTINAQPAIVTIRNQPVAAPAPAPAPLSGLRIVNGLGPNTNGAPPPAAKTHSSKP